MIVTQTPLRISLLGGGTDLPSFYKKEGYGCVVSMAINKYVYVTVKHLPEIFPFKYKLSYSKTELVNHIDDIEHPIIRECVSYLNIPNCDMSSMADIPAGTGMGSSSAFTVGLLRAMGGGYATAEALASEACDIEMNQVGSPIGKQDAYASALGGLNYLRFNGDESVWPTPLIMGKEKERKMMSSLMLFFLGKAPRSASALLEEQAKNTHTHALKQLRDLTEDLVSHLCNTSKLNLAGFFLEGWDIKKSIVGEGASQEADYYINKAIFAGAKGGKLLGAGGSGFVLIYVPDEDAKVNVRAALDPLFEVPFSMDTNGSMSYSL